jgi:RimJ/RimL family protein N-acetyltransferase
MRASRPAGSSRTALTCCSAHSAAVAPDFTTTGWHAARLAPGREYPVEKYAANWLCRPADNRVSRLRHSRGIEIDMFVSDLDTAQPSTRLVMPVVDRDAALSLQWLSGDEGRETLRMMGIAEELIRPVTLEEEAARITSFIEGQDQYNWMIELEGQVVGAIWVDLKPAASLGAPAVSLMIGAPTVRGRGVGQLSLHAVTRFMFRQQASQEIFARALVSNHKSAGLLASEGFARLHEPYVDAEYGLRWQNFVLPRPQGQG